MVTDARRQAGTGGLLWALQDLFMLVSGLHGAGRGHEGKPEKGLGDQVADDAVVFGEVSTQFVVSVRIGHGRWSFHLSGPGGVSAPAGALVFSCGPPSLMHKTGTSWHKTERSKVGSGLVRDCAHADTARYTERLAVMLSPDQRARLDAEAARRGMSAAQVVRAAVDALRNAGP